MIKNSHPNVYVVDIACYPIYVFCIYMCVILQ